MAEEQQINIPSLIIILFISGVIVKYFFLSPSTSSSNGNGRRQVDPAAVMRSREAAVERIQQMFPQVDRRTILWDLQGTGGNIAATTERVLSGRLETPPITFQPPPPPGQQSSANNNNNNNNNKIPATPAQPDLITRYNLKDKLNAPIEEEKAEQGGNGKKAWSQNKEERQSLLQKRRDQMILEARRKMEAKIKAEKEKAAAATS
ncbi:hypothetical protein QBC38DRAFT_451423 [Podospora fimiseda]|uniref:Coupling of ubiquitin conjugation to ER degradation protein 1 n=1 Tax=Podospora fimiseda TaxID=252190 RepID=A0AAN7H549_9PEZI|nr:hypothetical protein QBC38DRAFT_451423 [Podospora fimiseda]